MITMSLQDVVDKIQLNGKSSLFIDTCSFLDIFRVASRSGAAAEYYALSEIINKSKANLNVVAAETNIIEYDRNIANVKIELDRFIQKIKQNMGQLEEVSHYFKCGFDMSFKDVDSYNISDKLEQRLNELKSNLIVIKGDGQSINDGTTRAISKTPPSENGKIGDANFYCHFLNSWKNLRTKGYSNKILFMTSNKNDFGTVTDAFEPIKSELKQYSVLYCNKWAWASSEF